MIVGTSERAWIRSLKDRVESKRQECFRRRPKKHLDALVAGNNPLGGDYFASCLWRSYSVRSSGVHDGDPSIDFPSPGFRFSV